MASGGSRAQNIWPSEGRAPLEHSHHDAKLNVAPRIPRTPMRASCGPSLACPRPLRELFLVYRGRRGQSEPAEAMTRGSRNVRFRAAGSISSANAKIGGTKVGGGHGYPLFCRILCGWEGTDPTVPAITRKPQAQAYGAPNPHGCRGLFAPDPQTNHRGKSILLRNRCRSRGTRTMGDPLSSTRCHFAGCVFRGCSERYIGARGLKLR